MTGWLLLILLALWLTPIVSDAVTKWNKDRQFNDLLKKTYYAPQHEDMPND